MRNKIYLPLLLALIFVFTGCTSKNEAVKDPNKIPNPVENPGGYVPGIIDTKNKTEEDIKNATDKENQKIQNSMDENGLSSPAAKEEEDENLAKKYPFAVIRTNLGDIKVKLDAANAPKTVENFLKLASSKFYDGTKFHRVIKGFMIQGGDPNSKTANISSWGTGGPGYTLPAEIKLKNNRGTLATARQGDQVNPDRRSSGSQFYINTADNTSLDGQYTVFGEVVSGMDIVLKIENVKTGANDRPVEDVIMKSVEASEK